MESFPNVLTKIVKDYNVPTGTVHDIGTMQLGSDVGQVYTYYTQGQLSRTDNKLDMAISGSDNAFFTVAVPDASGNIKAYYTRDGSFSKSSNGTLVTRDGSLRIALTHAPDGGPVSFDFLAQPHDCLRCIRSTQQNLRAARDFQRRMTIAQQGTQTALILGG
jgi:flagellar hook protein FlgE